MPDLEIKNLIAKEIARQREGLTLIPSENYASEEVLLAMGTPLSNKYSEGYPQKRYYSGNQFIDKIEKIAIERAKRFLRLNTSMFNLIPVLKPTKPLISLFWSRAIKFWL